MPENQIYYSGTKISCYLSRRKTHPFHGSLTELFGNAASKRGLLKGANFIVKWRKGPILQRIDEKIRQQAFTLSNYLTLLFQNQKTKP